MDEDNPKALFRQQVPKSFLTLQQKCLEYAEHCADWAEPVIGGEDHQLHNGVGRGCEEVLVPVLNEEEFRYTCTCTCKCIYMYMYVYTYVHVCTSVCSIEGFCSVNRAWVCIYALIIHIHR